LERVTNAKVKVHHKFTNAEWRVRFFKVISVKYLVLDLDPDYQWVAVGHPSRNYGWIMARSQGLADPVYKGILQRLGEQGYDTGKFEKVPQQQAASASGSAP